MLWYFELPWLQHFLYHTDFQWWIVYTIKLPIWAINMSSKSVDSRRILQSKLSPPGARPPCSMIVCNETVKQSGIQWIKRRYIYRSSFWRIPSLTLRPALSSLLCVLSLEDAQKNWWCFFNSDCIKLNHNLIMCYPLPSPPKYIASLETCEP